MQACRPATSCEGGTVELLGWEVLGCSLGFVDGSMVRINGQGYFQGPPMMGPFMVSFPYYSHISRDSKWCITPFQMGPKKSSYKCGD